MAFKNDQVSENETAEILRLARLSLERGVPGDFVEMGCYKGDTALAVAEVLREFAKNHEDEPNFSHEKPSAEKTSAEKPSAEKTFTDGTTRDREKRLWLYDSFEGLPEKNATDESALGVDFKRGELLVSKQAVKKRFLKAGLKVPIIKKAWFSNLQPADLPEKIAFAFLDGDFYESILDSLKLVFPRLTQSGILIIHDYNNPALPGVEKAVAEFGLKNPRLFETMAVFEIKK